MSQVLLICRRTKHFHLCLHPEILIAMLPASFKRPFSLIKTFHPVKALGGAINGIGPDG